MSRSLPTCLSLLLLPLVWLAAAGPASAWQSRLTAADYAGNMQNFVGRELDHGLRVVALRADGNVLVLVLDGPAGWRSESEIAAVEASFFTGVCGRPPRPVPMFQDGVPMRVDTLDGGHDLRQGRVYTACPGT